jgi:hypothetical protein
MEPIIFILAFILSLVAYLALYARAGLAEDALWSKQQTLIGHGVCLGLPVHRPAHVQPSISAAPPQSDWRAPGA